MRAVEIIRKKREGGGTERRGDRLMVDGLANGEATNYQWSALLWRSSGEGCRRETVALTRSMMLSGSIADLSATPGLKIDKHSTGGGGQDVLILAPLPPRPECPCRWSRPWAEPYGGNTR